MSVASTHPQGSFGMGGQYYNGPTKKKPTPKPPAQKPVAKPPATAPTPTGPVTGTAPQVTDQNALADLQAILNQYGLGSLAQWAWGELTAGKTEAQVVLDLYNTPEFQQRFPGLSLRQQNGLPPISPADYINYEDSAIQIMKAAGLPSQFWSDPSTITNLIGGDTSLSELQQRVGLAAQAVYQSPQAVRDAMQRDYGISAGALTGYFLDPHQGLPALQQQFLAAQIGGAGTLTGYGTNKQLDERLASEGVSFGQAQSGFTDLGLKQQLFTPLPGEDGQTIDQNTQVGAEFEGNAAAQRQIALEAQRRVARFSGSGGFSTSSAGYSGLGVAQ